MTLHSLAGILSRRTPRMFEKFARWKPKRDGGKGTPKNCHSIFGQMLVSVFGRTDVSRISNSILEPTHFFADFVSGLFLLVFVGSAQETLKENPRQNRLAGSTIVTTATRRHKKHICQQFVHVSENHHKSK